MSTTNQRDSSKSVTRIVDGFLSYLQKNNDLTLLPAIVQKLQHTVDLQTNSGEILSSIPLSKDQIQEIEAIMAKKIGAPVSLKNIVQKDILGGLIVRVNDLLIDLSMKSQLSEIKKSVYR